MIELKIKKENTIIRRCRTQKGNSNFGVVKKDNKAKIEYIIREIYDTACCCGW